MKTKLNYSKTSQTGQTVALVTATAAMKFLPSGSLSSSSSQLSVSSCQLSTLSISPILHSSDPQMTKSLSWPASPIVAMTWPYRAE